MILRHSLYIYLRSEDKIGQMTYISKFSWWFAQNIQIYHSKHYKIIWAHYDRVVYMETAPFLFLAHMSLFEIRYIAIYYIYLFPDW